jgi:hypothetical protein
MISIRPDRSSCGVVKRIFAAALVDPTFCDIVHRVCGFSKGGNKMNIFKVGAEWDHGKHSRHIIITATFIIICKNISKVNFRL